MQRDRATRVLARDATVLAGPGGPPIGTVKAGAEIQLVDDGAAFVRFTMSRRGVEAGPRGFYLQAAPGVMMTSPRSGSATLAP
jgi:hypothetical protein